MRDTIAVDLGTIPYASGLEIQRRLVSLRVEGAVPDVLLLCQHPPVVTLGRAGGREHVGEEIVRRGIPVAEVERGGDATYHGPGQLVGYPIVALEGEERDLHRLLRGIEEVVIRAAAGFGVAAERTPGLTGVWVGNSKLCAIGVAVRRWVTLHGFALNVNTDLQPFDWIVPCGLHGRSVTSLERLLGAAQDLDAVQEAVIRHFGAVFSRSVRRTNLEEMGLSALLPRGRAGEEQGSW